MPDLIKLYIRSCAIGFILAAVFVVLLLGFDIMKLRHLVMHSESGVLAVVLLWFMNGIVFAGVQFGYAVMRIGRDDDDDGPGGGTPIWDPVAIPVRVDDPQRRRPRR